MPRHTLLTRLPGPHWATGATGPPAHGRAGDAPPPPPRTWQSGQLPPLPPHTGGSPAHGRLPQEVRGVTGPWELIHLADHPGAASRLPSPKLGAGHAEALAQGPARGQRRAGGGGGPGPSCLCLLSAR